MKLFSRIKCALTQPSWDKYMSDWLAGNDVSGTSPDMRVDENSALKLNVFFACLRVLGETFASVPVNEYKRVDENTRLKTNDTGIYDVLHNKPNDEMSPFAFKEMAAYQVNLSGNFIAHREETKYGELLGLYPFESKNVEISREEQSPKRLLYKVHYDGSVDTKTYYRKELFHLSGPSTNGIVGMSPIQYAVESIRLGKTWEQMGNKLFKNGTYPTGVFEHPAELKLDAYERLKKDIEQRWTGEKNFGRPILAEDGLTFKSLGINLKDMEIIESRRFTTEDICRIYRVPLHLVQDLSRSTNNNIEHQSLEFVMYTMLPWFKRTEEAINSQLLSREMREQGYYFEFNIATLLRGDQKSMAEAFATGRQWGWLSVNDIRRMLNMNPIDNGDIYLQPMNMIEAGEKVEIKRTGLSNALKEVTKIIEDKGV